DGALDAARPRDGKKDGRAPEQPGERDLMRREDGASAPRAQRGVSRHAPVMMVAAHGAIGDERDAVAAAEIDDPVLEADAAGHVAEALHAGDRRDLLRRPDLRRVHVAEADVLHFALALQ